MLTDLSAPSPLAAFRYRPFALFWVARSAATFATQIQSTALGWQVYDAARAAGQSIEDAAFLLGLIGLAQFLPLLALSLIGGNMADRHDRRRIVLACVAAEAVIALVLALTPGLAYSAQITAIFAAAATIGAINAFLPAASSSLVPSLVPAAVLPQAIAVNSLSWQTGSIAGPALGGLLYGLGAPVAYGAAAALLGLSAALVTLIEAPHVRREGQARTVAMIMEGLRYVRANPMVLGAISLDLAVVFLAGATALLPVYARDILHAGPEALGLLRAAPAIGAALVAGLLAVRPITRNVGPWMFGSVIVFGLATIGFGLSTVVWLSVVMLAITGAADAISVYVRVSLIQLATPDAMRGRVSAVSNVFISASNELGEFESGVAAWAVGPVAAVVLGGSGALGVSLLWMRLFPPLARADRFPDAAAAG